ncbi:MAG: shikimate kinase [Ramlibacter sp.]|nr:shikimate kinase [Ramlibacter sp.]
MGLPGSGKTTVGRQLSRRLALSFVDSDQVIEERLGCSIRHYFDQHGEEPFRDVEESVIGELMHAPSTVVSTGGGAVLRASNRRALRRGHVVYLRASPEELFRRLRHDVSRPLLQVADPLGRLRELHAVRDPLYGETAHFRIETGRTSLQTLVNKVIMQLELAGVAISG